MKTSPGAATAGGICLTGALLWAGVLSTDGGIWDPVQLVILAGGLVILATAALVGMVVKGSRWGRRMAGGLAVGELGVAMVAPVSGWWWAGVGVAAATLALVSGPWLATTEKRRAPSLGPPSRAVLLLCVLASLPVALAAVSVNGLGGGWGMAAVSAAIAPAYAKALPGSLLAARFAVPAAGVVAAFTTPWPGWTAVVGGGLLAAWAAWSEEARLAVQPLVDTRPDPTPAPGPTPLRIKSASELPGRRRPVGDSEKGRR